LHKCLQERDEKPKTFRQLDATKNGNKKFLGKKISTFFEKKAKTKSKRKSGNFGEVFCGKD
jgi:hypothetical protein